MSLDRKLLVLLFCKDQNITVLTHCNLSEPTNKTKSSNSVGHSHRNVVMLIRKGNQKMNVIRDLSRRILERPTLLDGLI